MLTSLQCASFFLLVHKEDLRLLLSPQECAPLGQAPAWAPSPRGIPTHFWYGSLPCLQLDLDISSQDNSLGLALQGLPVPEDTSLSSGSEDSVRKTLNSALSKTLPICASIDQGKPRGMLFKSRILLLLDGVSQNHKDCRKRRVKTSVFPSVSQPLSPPGFHQCDSYLFLQESTTEYNYCTL